MNGDRFIEIVLWMMSIILAIVFFYNGISKILGTPSEVSQYHAMGISSTILVIVGFLEILGAILITIPRFTLIGGVGLVIIMVASAGFNMMHDNIEPVLRAVIFAALLIGLCFMRFRRRDFTPPA